MTSTFSRTSWLKPAIPTPTHLLTPSSMRTGVRLVPLLDSTWMTCQPPLPASRSPMTRTITTSLDPHYAAVVRPSQLHLPQPGGCAQSGLPPLSDLSITANLLSPLPGCPNFHSRRVPIRRRPHLSFLFFPRPPSPQRRRSVESSLELISSFVIVTNQTSLRSEGGIAAARGPAQRAPRAALLLD